MTVNSGFLAKQQTGPLEKKKIEELNLMIIATIHIMVIVLHPLSTNSITVTFEGAEFAQLLVRFGQVTPNL